MGKYAAFFRQLEWGVRRDHIHFWYSKRHEVESTCLRSVRLPGFWNHFRLRRKYTVAYSGFTPGRSFAEYQIRWPDAVRVGTASDFQSTKMLMKPSNHW